MLALSTEPAALFAQYLYNLGVGLAFAVAIGVVGGLALRFSG